MIRAVAWPARESGASALNGQGRAPVGRALLTPAPTPLTFSLVRDQRHTDARAAGDLQAWLSWLELGGLSLETRQSYEWTLGKLLRSYPDKQLADFTTDDLMLVLRTYPPRSRRVRSAAFAGWFRWAYKTRRITENPMDFLPQIKRGTKRPIVVFTDVERSRLEELPNPDGVLYQLLFAAGLRRGEALNLRARDCQLERGQILIYRGKGDKDRIVPMTAPLRQALADWFLVDAIKPTDYLWAAKPGGHRYRRDRPMGDTSFQYWHTKCLEKAEISHLKAHTTRHTFATNWRRRGGRAETLQVVLGHASIRTTIDEYVHLGHMDVLEDMALIEAEIE